MKAKESVLERVIKETKNSKHPSPFQIKDIIPSFDGPWFDVGRRAIQILEEKEEIKEFTKKYIDYIHQNYKLSTEEAEKSAKEILGYCTGYVDDAQANKWFNALPDITHPITGRERPFRGADKTDLYYVVGKSNDEKVKKYITKAFAEELPESWYKVLDKKTTVQGRDNKEYFAIRIKPLNNNSMQTHMFLTGFMYGLTSRVEEELGKPCKLSLEMIKRK
ncbi:hypothetical protein HZA97_09580 [Candidatus Woesearchaeota archaeon]|nr:hypothetical protein [Candidatus Woesearchaeota archaeon]